MVFDCLWVVLDVFEMVTLFSLELSNYGMNYRGDIVEADSFQLFKSKLKLYLNI